jgi:radical SAM superfamily enzyme YgiQ (UPF0313 family)
MIDLVILSVPGVVRHAPQAAPALLKASIEDSGFSCTTIDFNLKFYQSVPDYDTIETYFSTGLNLEEAEKADQLVSIWTQEILALDPKFIGISVFTYQNRVATELFCKHIRKHSTVKIVLGGQGLSDGGIEGATGFAKKLQEQGLIDFWIKSEGERSIVELLKGNYDYPGINSDSFIQIENLNELPFPNYDDYLLDAYENRSLPITGSRGCVRACSFCDIHEHWKYRYRAGENIMAEIVHLNQRYNITQFNFSDSLINGNLKEFKKFTKLLADYNKTTNNKITWSSQFIVRPESQLTEEYWQNIADSGGGSLAIGVETGSDRVRAHMNKKFNNQDLDYTMSMLEKYNITCTFLMIVGYPTETEKDFQDTLDMFVRYRRLANSVITNINIGATLGILPGTPLYYHADEHNIELDKYENNWVALDNIELTLEARLNRRKKLKDHVIALGYYLKRDSTENMMEILEHNKEMFNKRTQIKKMIRIKNLNQSS